MGILRRNRDIKSLFSKVWSSMQTVCILLLLAPFIILAGLLYGEECDNIYN